MRIVQTVAGLALRPVLRSVLDLTGTAILGEPAEKLIGALIDRFTSHSGRVSSALADANEQAWKALEVALAGGSWLASADVKDFAAQIDLFLKHTPLGELGSEARFGPACLKELRAARKAGLLTGQVEMTAVLEQAGRFARFSDPTVLVETEGAALAEVAKPGRRPESQRLPELGEWRRPPGLP